MFIAIADSRGDSEFAYIRTSRAGLPGAGQLFWGQAGSLEFAAI
jgi:hypothetical protein